MDEALIAILEEKTFEYISVREICEKAEVNRSTFYLHYENTCDLLTETVRYLIDGFLAYFPVELQKIHNGFASCDLPELNFITEEYLHPFLTYIKDHRRVFATMLSRADILGWNDVYQRMFCHIFNPILERFHYPAESRRYVMRFYIHGILAVVEEWLKEECTRPIREISGIICTCIFGLDGNTNPER